MDDGLIECVDHFSYLGSMIANENNLDAEISYRIVKASKAFDHYETLFCDHASICALCRPIKQYVYQACTCCQLFCI